MAAMVEIIDIARPREDVFAYATDFARFPEWQGGVVSVRREDDVPLAVGSRAVVTRRAGPRTLARGQEITALGPPRAWAVRGVGGPLTAMAKGTIEPLADGERSRVTIALELTRCRRCSPALLFDGAGSLSRSSCFCKKRCRLLREMLRHSSARP